MSKELNTQELHNLAMNLVGKELEANGFDFMAVNSKLTKNPQFVCIKNKQFYFVIVRHIEYPMDPKDYDKSLVDKVKKIAEQNNAKTFYAGVGLANADTGMPPVCLNENYIVDYDGLIEV